MIWTASFLRYINVGRLLHLIAFLDLVISGMAVYFIVTIDGASNPGVVAIWTLVLIMFGGMSIYAELDGYSRFQDYKRVKDQIYFYGFQDRIIRRILRSRCQRDAGLLACKELGLGTEVKEYYTKSGYRWYHIIPDFVFDDPGFFFKSYFWMGTFFTPYYEPKVDYSLIGPGNLNLSTKHLRIEEAA